MPTYTFRCPLCGAHTDLVLSISTYLHSPPAPVHCAAVMERFITVDSCPAMANALASERHYDGLRATDGTDISTRAKHKAYMKERNLTTIDDYTETWKRDARERADRLEGKDATRAADIAHAIHSLGG